MTASAAPQDKILLVVHTATNPTLPGASPPHFAWPDYFNFTIGNLATGEAGRLIAAIQQAIFLGTRRCRLFLPVPYHKLIRVLTVATRT